MTREERDDAINYFKNKLKNEVYGAKYNKLAIEALEQEPFINKPCVSEKVCEHDKQMVLDKLRAEIAEYGSIMVSYAITKDTKTDKGIEKLVSGVLKQAKEQVLEVIDKYKAEIEPQESEDNNVSIQEKYNE